MSAKRTPSRTGKRGRSSEGPPPLDEVLEWLRRRGTRKDRDALARYGIPASKAVGVPVSALKAYARDIGRDHALAAGLWASGVYEARLLAAFVDEPELVTPRQMNAWARDFDNWAVVDTVCFHLFDRAPAAWGRVAPWARARAEFEKRGAFALLWSLALHDREAPDERFLDALPLLERGAMDGRHFVEKGVEMALRAILRRGLRLREATLALAERLQASEDPSARRIGRSIGREGAAPKRKTRKAPPRSP